MKKTALRYGLLSGLIIVVLFFLSWLIFGNDTQYEVREVFGYASIFISLLFVFFGIKHYRDKENGGWLSFGKGMQVGLLITLVPSLLFGLFNALYVSVLNPGFMKTYYTHELEQMQRTMTPEKFAQARVAAEAEWEFFSNPVISSLVMALTVFIIGVIVTVISALILKRSRGVIAA